MYINRMSEVVKSYEDGKRPDGINDYLEMFHIVQFMLIGKKVVLLVSSNIKVKLLLISPS